MEDSGSNPQTTRRLGEQGQAPTNGRTVPAEPGAGAWPPPAAEAPWPPVAAPDVPPADAWPPAEGGADAPPEGGASAWAPFPPAGNAGQAPDAGDWPPIAPVSAHPVSGRPTGGEQVSGGPVPSAWAPAPESPTPRNPVESATGSYQQVPVDGWPPIPEPPAIDPFGGQHSPAEPPAAHNGNGHGGPWSSRPPAGTPETWNGPVPGPHQEPASHAQPPAPPPPAQAAPPPPAQPQQAPQQQTPTPAGPPPQQQAPQGPPAPVPQGPPRQPPVPQHPYGQQPPPASQLNREVYQQQQWRPTPDQQRQPGEHAPTADDFAQRRAARPAEPIANQGMRRAVRVGSFGLVKMGPGRKEQDQRHAVEMVRRNFGGLRQITVVNPKGGAGKTVAVLMVAMTFGQKRGGYVLAWDNNETQGTLGMRAQQDFHNRTVRDLLRDLAHFRGPTGRVGDLSQYVRAQGEAMFDVLASDESATAGEMLTAQAFGDIREVVSRFYKLIVVDTGNNVRAANWQSAIDATDQLVVCMSARNDSAETAARALDHLEQTGRHDLVRRAVTVVSMPAHRKDLDLPAVQRHFSARTRAVLLAPYEKLLDSGVPIRYAALSQSSRDAWLKIAAAVAEGL